MVVMDDTSGLCIPDVPLARIDDDVESNASTLDKDEKHGHNLSSGVSDGTQENLAVSLEDLVEHFDQKVNKALKDMNESTNQLAPIKVRSEDEVMSESQVWWTLTGQYGTILPLDFSKTQIRRNQIEALSLDTPRAVNFAENSLQARSLQLQLSDEGALCNSELPDEDEMRQSMDLHQMISENLTLNHESPLVSADQVIEEIDSMFQTHDLMHSMTTDRTIESVDSLYSSMRSPFTVSQVDTDLKHHEAINLSTNELSTMPHSKLLTLSTEMEQLILMHNSKLVAELAHRDELEYEKEIKNKFITLLVSIQDQRRKYIIERKKKINKPVDISQLPQYVTASIPFDESQRSLNVLALESLIRILEAINENNPQVPSLLTDYILTVVCPSNTVH